MNYYVVQKANGPLVGVHEIEYRKLFSWDKEYILVAEFNCIEELIKIERD